MWVIKDLVRWGYYFCNICFPLFVDIPSPETSQYLYAMSHAICCVLHQMTALQIGIDNSPCWCVKQSAVDVLFIAPWWFHCWHTFYVTAFYVTCPPITVWSIITYHCIMHGSNKCRKWTRLKPIKYTQKPCPSGQSLGATFTDMV